MIKHSFKRGRFNRVTEQRNDLVTNCLDSLECSIKFKVRFVIREHTTDIGNELPVSWHNHDSPSLTGSILRDDIYAVIHHLKWDMLIAHQQTAVD